MGYSVNKMKERAEELAEGYDEAKDEQFIEEFEDFIQPYMDRQGNFLNLTQDDVQGFLDSFTFPDEGDWAFAQVQSELDEIGDQKYEQMRDERMGL